MKKKRDTDAQQQFMKRLKELWPLAKGSLAEVRKPCIRANCSACAKGEKHPAIIFSCRDNKRVRCMYVPKDLAPTIRKAIDNGRELERLLSQLGPELIREHRKERDKRKGSVPRQTDK